MEARTNRSSEGRGTIPLGVDDLSRMGTAAREEVERGADRARAALTRADQALRDVVRERPFAAVGLALAVGYLISRGLTRR